MERLDGHAQRFARRHGLAGPGLVGVSGGMDSVVLLHALRRAGVPVEAAHVHYGLRGADADADAAFAEALCGAWNVPFHLYRVPPGDVPPASRQAWARALRYAWFADVARRQGMGWVAVAHHADDQAETLLLALLRGTGLAGLGGMKPVRRLAPGADIRLARPFLDCPRSALRAYADRHALAWRDDASNADPRYRRAWLRAEIMPRLRARFGDDVAQKLAHLAAQARQHVLPLWQARREALARRALDGDRLRLDVLGPLGAAERGRLLLDALEALLPGAPRTAATAAQLAALVDAQVGRRVHFGAGTVWRERGALRFVATPTAPVEMQLLHPGSTLALPGGTLVAGPIGPPPASRHAPDSTCWLDADEVAWPLAVRPWRAGDVLEPFGMTGRKKVSDVLTDARVPPSARAGTAVVCAGEAILWVPGVRRGRIAPVGPATRRAVKLDWHARP